MWAAFALLALLVAFLFSARSVRIVIEPEPEHAEVSGILAVEIGGRYLLLSGTHRVQAEKPEYRELDAEIQVGPEQNQEIVLRLERLPGILEVTTGNVRGAEVFVDGEPRAQTPGELEIPEGVHELGVVKERYLPYSESVAIQGGGARQALGRRTRARLGRRARRLPAPGRRYLHRRRSGGRDAGARWKSWRAVTASNCAWRDTRPGAANWRCGPTDTRPLRS